MVENALRCIEQADVAGKRVLVRVDLNVPMQGGVITDTTRIERVLPTIELLVKRGARVVILSHFGRPRGEAERGYVVEAGGRRHAGLAGRNRHAHF